MVRLYAKVVGVTVILIGVVGLLLGDKSLFGVLNIDLAEDASTCSPAACSSTPASRPAT